MRQRSTSYIALGAVAAALAAGVLLIRGGEADGGAGPRGYGPASFFGVNAPILRDYAASGNSAGLDAVAREMAARGIEWARVPLDQNVEQRGPGAIDWSIPDAVVGALASHGIHTSALFVGTAAWTADPGVVRACGARSYPANTGAWSAFVGEAARRYGRQGSFWAAYPGVPRTPIETWEIGNEENLRNFWCPNANPEQYAAVYGASREAALAADPEAEVIVGGLAGQFGGGSVGDVAVPDFLRRMVAADPGLASEIPAVAIHPYGEDPDAVLEAVRRFREAMRDAGLGRTPMIANEVGWYTSGPRSEVRTSDSERARRIEELALAMPYSGCGVDALGVHAWVTTERDPGDPESWYGIADPAGRAAREGARAYGEGIAAVRSGSELSRDACP